MAKIHEVLHGTTLVNTVAKLGGKGITKCYQCGTCTATCPVSESVSTNFRKTIKYLQLGLETKVLGDLSPWLCYYCGDCKESCPRDANPSEIMAAIRRYQIGRYDWTGFSARLQQSKLVELFSVVALAMATILIVGMFHGPIVSSRVELATFAPLSTVENAEMVVLVVLSALLLSNIFRMYRFTMADGGIKRGGLSSLREFIRVVPAYFLTQFPMTKCSSKKRWTEHLLIFGGYATAFMLTIFFLGYIQTNERYPITHPTKLIGYAAAGALLYGTGMSIARRLRRQGVYYESARHSTDWMFLILLFLTALTGLFVGIFSLLGEPLLTYTTYTLHLAFVVPLLVLEVPFAKWSHLAYRPFAAYFSTLKGMKIPTIRGG